MTATSPLAIAAALAVGALDSAPASAQDVAVGGMDTVEMYVTGRSVPGRPDLMTAWHGHAWLFVSDINRAAFEADPRRYPATDILLASPECTNHSQARGVSRRRQDPSLFDQDFDPAAERTPQPAQIQRPLPRSAAVSQKPRPIPGPGLRAAHGKRGRGRRHDKDRAEILR